MTSDNKSRGSLAIIVGGLIAGTFDITFAFLFYGHYGVSAPRVLQSVASGLLGRNAFTGGIKVMALGLGLHYLIALIWAAIYFGASRVLAGLARLALLWGPIYGAFIYGAMNKIVLPLSAAPFKPSFAWRMLIPALLIHMFGIGLPIALATKAFSRK